jgi:hypothetical protein
MKKNLISIFLFALMISYSFFGCKKVGFLDNQSTNNINEQVTFADSAKTLGFLTAVYSKVDFLNPNKLVQDLAAGLYATTDESETMWPGAQNVPNQIFQGTFGTQFYTSVSGKWSHLYTSIRNANVYLKNVDNSPLSPVLKARTKLEARFLRAYYYHILLKMFGGITLLGDEPKGLSDPNTDPRNSFEECVNYIVSELDALAPDLPISYQGLDYGRVTKGAALALKSRVLLGAASPLFNGGSFATDPKIIATTAYPTYDVHRWQKALDAAKAVMDLNRYSLQEDNVTRPGNGFYQMFLDRVNNEAIFQRMLGTNREYETSFLPKSRNGNFLPCPSQQLVDAFPMMDGSAFNPANYTNKQNPYLNRDPRLSFTIIYNGALYYDTRNNINTKTPVYTYVGAATDGIVAATANTASNTGYYCRKMCDENITGSIGNTTRCSPLIRYAEVLLNYAEAANELDHTELAMQQLIAIRKRAGILKGNDSRYGIPSDPNKEEARDLIRNERFIELAFEELRYFDIRRWRILDQYDGKYIIGMRITNGGTTANPGDYTYARFNDRTPRVFKDRAYFFPIPPDEININQAIVQNPGW